MTGPVVPSDEELIAALADEYARWTAAPYEPDDWQRNNGDDLARANLLPVVRRYADQRAAEELRWRAAMIWTRAAQEDEAVEAALSETAAWLHARAAALTAREEAGR